MSPRAPIAPPSTGRPPILGRPAQRVSTQCTAARPRAGAPGHNTHSESPLNSGRNCSCDSIVRSTRMGSCSERHQPACTWFVERCYSAGRTHTPAPRGYTSTTGPRRECRCTQGTTPATAPPSLASAREVKSRFLRFFQVAILQSHTHTTRTPPAPLAKTPASSVMVLPLKTWTAVLRGDMAALAKWLRLFGGDDKTTSIR